ncbi:MAG TPA: glycoside hydrolase family 27 protein [Verrucomicrobiae bacterium]|nr:glycoside hydrolase family 27 protein [Verrucomicrobiae bacterium]
MKTNSFLDWAPTPPMGWNSWDCFGATVTEPLVKANADYMAEKLARHGWKYIVVDIQWYEPQSGGWNYSKNPEPVLDEYGRLLPVVAKFPSSKDGNGFKPLADYVHGKGLKFGVHLMRGIPREAVKSNTRILGSTHTASEIADRSSICRWNPDMFGVDMTKPGAQEYYNSVFDLLASWGVDFVKVDDLSRPYHKPEIEAIRKAIDQCGRPMVLSTSPGPTPISEAKHVVEHANMWRLTDDFWDEWRLLKHAFDTSNDWTPYRAPGHWPDPDMLPLGALRVGPKMQHNWTRFTKDEQRTLMTLWSIARAPLMFGGHLPWNDDWTLSLITNDEVLAVDQSSSGNRQLFRTNETVAWIADAPNSKDRYLALFNISEKTNGTNAAPMEISVPLKMLGFSGTVRARDLWSQKDIGNFAGTFSQKIPPHGAGIYRISPVEN